MSGACEAGRVSDRRLHAPADKRRSTFKCTSSEGACLMQSSSSRWWPTLTRLVCAHPSRIEVGRTPRYTHVTGKEELAVYATALIRKGEELLGECRGGLAPLTLSEEAEMSGLDSEMVRTAAAARVAPVVDGPDSLNQGTTSTSVQALPVGRAMRDFSTVRSTRLKRNVIFLGPARFVNVSSTPCPRHDATHPLDCGVGISRSTTATRMSTSRLSTAASTSALPLCATLSSARS